MKVLLRSVIIASSSRQTVPTDILIDNGVITKISEKIEATADKVIQKENLHVAVGWMDCFANFCDPGEEHKETLETGSNGAAAGGYTEVMLIPNTQPPVHNKSQVEYIIRASSGFPVTLYPIGAISKNTEGKELSEMYDMHTSGAIAFSDGIRAVQSSGLLLKALEYLRAVDAVVIQLPDDKTIATLGLMNEGVVSLQLGLPGRPAIAEEIQIARDIELLKYTGSKIHFTGVSTRRSLEIISIAKQQGLNISCSVAPHHLFFTDEDLNTYDTHLKVNPPLRTHDDREALRDGVKNGTVDFIASHHQPQHWDDKTCEFEYAKYGMTSLECVFGISGACGISSDTFVKMQSQNIRNLFNIDVPEISEGAIANLTLFDPDAEYVFSEINIYSRSRNNPYIGKKLTGKSFGIINGDKLFLNEIN